MSSWGTITVGAWRAENIYLNTCWIWGNFSINRRSLSTLLLFHYHRRLSRQNAHMALKLLFINSSCACVPKSPFFGRQGPKYFIWPIRIRARKNEPIRSPSDFIQQAPMAEKCTRLCFVCVSFLVTFTTRWNAGTTIEMKWNEMQGITIDSRLCFP